MLYYTNKKEIVNKNNNNKSVGVELPTKFSEKGGLTGGIQFYITNKLKSEIFNDKKSLYTKIFFSVITKNLIWEILTKNFVTFKRWDGVKDENFIFMRVYEKPIYRGNCLKGGGLDSLQI